jgi:PAS domain S-box-containing protein
MGLLFYLAGCIGTLCFLPFQFAIWSAGTSITTAAVVLVMLGLPFLLRQTRGIRILGQLVCAGLAIISATSMWMSAGQAIGILPFLPVLSVIALLVGGRNSALLWGCAALGITGLGLGLSLSGQLPVEGYQGSTAIDRYTIAIMCVVGMAAAAQLFETFWDRTAIEVANRAQAELVAREERGRIFLEYATEGVLMMDKNAVVKFASPAAERLVGVEPGGAMGHRLREFTTPEDFERTWPVWANVLSNPDGLGQWELRTRPGLGSGDPADSKLLDVTASNRLTNSAVEGVIVRMRDITELARAEANYQTLVEHSLQGILVECDRRIVYANQALAKLLQLSTEELMQMDLHEPLAFVHDEDRERVRERFMQPDKSQPEAIEMRFLRPDGEWRWIQMQWTEASWEGRPAVQIAYADITPQKELAAHQERENDRLETAIRERTQELEASQIRLRDQERMAAVGTLAAGIAHQINNPVGAILTSADFAIRTSEEDNSEQIRSDALAEIRAQAIRCGKIVRIVLQFARAEPTEKSSGDVASVLHRSVDATASYASDRGTLVKLALVAETRERSVLMNPIELEQVFVNLIRNAAESQDSGATVTITTWVEGNEIEIRIEDDGPGISEIHANHVFDPFYTTRLQQGGTGLGLSVAHGIIEDHGGRMWLENLEDDTPNTESSDESPIRGARFLVRLPMEKTSNPIDTN